MEKPPNVKVSELMALPHDGTLPSEVAKPAKHATWHFNHHKDDMQGS